MFTAYFSMEIALRPDMKTYSGGLGILSGDTLKSCADLGLNMAGVTLLYKNGYFKQSIDPDSGKQVESNDEWDYKNKLVDTNKTFHITIENRDILVKLWKYDIVSKSTVPVYFLDTNLPENDYEDQAICFNLYSKYDNTRLKQEIMIGVGSVMALQTLGYDIADKYHLNESHATFAIPYLEKVLGNHEKAAQKIVFTTHTPLEHGHKKYAFDTLRPQLGDELTNIMQTNNEDKSIVNLTKYCLDNCIYSNAVARKHSEVMHKMFPTKHIDYITNGVHTYTWVAPATAEVFDKYCPDWRLDPSDLRNAMNIPEYEMRTLHTTNKKRLFEMVEQRLGKKFSTDKFTIGFARRVDGYKRQNFIFKDLDRLCRIAQKFGGLQFVFAGKAYPDTAGPDSTLAEVYRLSQRTDLPIDIVYIPDYDMTTSEYMVAGVDIWLNNPLRPLEASGTSGMKATLNGVPNFSVVDGWWVEGIQENETGWAIGDENSHMGNEEYELNDLYGKLEHIILPTYHYDTKKWLEIQKQAIAINASYFNTQRMVTEYLTKGYLK